MRHRILISSRTIPQGLNGTQISIGMKSALDQVGCAFAVFDMRTTFMTILSLLGTNLEISLHHQWALRPTHGEKMGMCPIEDFRQHFLFQVEYNVVRGGVNQETASNGLEVVVNEKKPSRCHGK